MIEIAPKSENKMTYDEALLYCRFCNHNGHTDWRMPYFSEGTPGAFYGWCTDSFSTPDMKGVVFPVRDIVAQSTKV
jgi:hypothetical protein